MQENKIALSNPEKQRLINSITNKLESMHMFTDPDKQQNGLEWTNTFRIRTVLGHSSCYICQISERG